jgi:hypothetical protein
MFAPSMILLEVDAAGFAILEFEGDAPGSVDVNRITLGIEPLQWMKVEAWNVHFLSPDSDVETIEPCEDTFMHLRVDLRTFALGPKLRKGFVFEGPDHAPT